ncbi:GNAT family N-acetyltransferase ['Paenibacillus yunnanensis' Narsing Rao et al. 2020]|uniref:GNAT family N-acetyltransferase n=1 Tax=Paenibacillus tengchongensis TaxID=2608684 RepID=UPI00124D73C7|nr:GNAT family N-acetyltransferase [Paenibacillus tengchongensis]
MSTYEAAALPIRQGARVELRKLHGDEGERLTELLARPEVAPHIMLHRKDGPLRSQLALLVYRMLRGSDPRALHTGIYLRGGRELIGTVSLQSWNRLERTAVLGYMLDPLWWGQGLATEAVGLLLEYGLQELRLVRVEGRCRSGNIRSERVMLKSGLSLERMLPMPGGSGDVMKVFTLLHN